MEFLISFLLLVTSYLYGSIPFALVIGKLFYNTDIRNSGSGNLGGTNAGRVLGKKAGLAVIILDVSKCAIAVGIAKFVSTRFGINSEIIYPCALACVIGHCYPIFAHFRGGKAVSVMMGYALATSFYAFLIALGVFLINLKITKYVSLSSILGSIALVIVSPFFGFSPLGIMTNVIISGLLIYKHKANIQRIKDGTESKITWM